MRLLFCLCLSSNDDPFRRVILLLILAGLCHRRGFLLTLFVVFQFNSQLCGEPNMNRQGALKMKPTLMWLCVSAHGGFFTNSHSDLL